MKYLFKRILGMPRLLILFSLTPWLVMTLFLSTSLGPGFQADVFGTPVSRDQWWASGGGALVTAGFAIYTAQLLSIIYPVRHAALIVGGAWVAFALAEIAIGPAFTKNVVGDSLFDSWVLIAAINTIVGVLAYLLATFSAKQRAYLDSTSTVARY